VLHASGPVKRSVTIAGHATSISLEPAFWAALAEAAEAEALPINALVARIDAARSARPDPPNLASALRVWLLERARAGSAGPPGDNAIAAAGDNGYRGRTTRA